MFGYVEESEGRQIVVLETEIGDVIIPKCHSESYSSEDDNTGI